MNVRSLLAIPRTRRSTTAALWWLETPTGLVAMFAAGFLLRVLIAPHAGFYGDLGLFRQWTSRLAAVGMRHFYVPGQFADYPPGYLYVLWLLGKVSATPGYLLLKLPALLADLGLAWIAGLLGARIAPTDLKQRLPIRALVIAAVLFNPAVIALSAVWGQVDAVPAMFVLWSLLLLFTGSRSLRREIGAFLLFAVAVGMKPQAGWVLPVMLYSLYRRYLHRRPREELFDGALTIAMTGALSLGLWAVSGLAFGLGPVSLVRFYRHSASVYPVTSANAFNLWGFLAFWRNDSTGTHTMTIAGVSALHLGMLLFIVASVAVLWRVHRGLAHGGNEPLVLSVASAVLSLLAYTLLTRMHERYMFLALAGLAPLVFVRRLRLVYAALSGLFVLNLWYPYAFFNTQWGAEGFHVQPYFDWIFGGFATDTWQKKVWSLAVTAIAVVVGLRAIRWVEGSTGESEAGPHTHEPAATPVSVSLQETDERAWSTHELARAVRALLPRRAALFVDGWAGRKPSRWWPRALVGLSCLFGLVVLRGETTPAPNLNDSAFHLEMVRWASGQIGEGRVPLDGWFPYFSMGSSFFHHYQSLSETLTAYAARLTGAGDQTTYLWILYLLLALWPISVYLAARLLGLGRWTAAASAAVSPLIVSAPGYGYEHGSYTWRGYGVYSQLWAMWLLPLAWGLTWRAVSRGRHYGAAAAALALTIACHFITGYLAVLTVGVWVIVLGAGFLRRIGRAALVVAGSLLVASWVLVPLIGDTRYTTQSEYYKGTIFNDSYGARKVLGWLFTGKLFDNGRFPIVTILFFLGVVICLRRARGDLRARALLGAFTLSLLLFFGRPTLGRLLDLLPGFGDVQIHRFVMGVHLAGIFISGVGLAWAVRQVLLFGCRLAETRLELGRRTLAASGAAAVALPIALLTPAWKERASYDAWGAHLIHAQRAADTTDGRDLDRLVDIVAARNDGRVYAGLRSNWGHDYAVWAVPVYAWLADRGIDAVGFTFRTIPSLSTDVEAAFDETNPAQYQMFNVRYLILPSDHSPPVKAKLIASSGRHRLWEVATSGYFQVVDRSSAVSADRTDLEQVTRAFRTSDLASRGVYPGVAFAGAAPPPPTYSGASPPRGPSGRVIAQTETLQDGSFSATVVAKRPAVVLLKASYDPRWRVTVDGAPAEAVMMAPSLVGVTVGSGYHTVSFRYRSYPHYTLLVMVGVLSLLGLLVAPRLTSIRKGVSRRRVGRWPRLAMLVGLRSCLRASRSASRNGPRSRPSHDVEGRF